MSNEDPNTSTSTRDPTALPGFERLLAEARPLSAPDDRWPSRTWRWRPRTPVSIRRVAWWSVSDGCAFSEQLSRPPREGPTCNLWGQQQREYLEWGGRFGGL